MSASAAMNASAWGARRATARPRRQRCARSSATGWGVSPRPRPARSADPERGETLVASHACYREELQDMIDRRSLLGATVAGTGAMLLPDAARAMAAAADPVAPYRTPYKYPKLILAGSGIPGSFDEKAVDCPFVFSANGKFYLTHVGFDGRSEEHTSELQSLMRISSAV